MGQLAQWAATRHLFGSDFLYRVGRHVADRDPSRGDAGEDVPGLNLDVKGTRIGAEVGDLSAYHLLVRPGERRPGHVYLLALVELPREGDEFRGARVYLVGWAEDGELPPEPSRDPRFAGAHALPASLLHPVPPFRWFQIP